LRDFSYAIDPLAYRIAACSIDLYAENGDISRGYALMGSRDVWIIS